ncbi:MAG: cold-shock protein [Micropepsaceae bacterium]
MDTPVTIAPTPECGGIRVKGRVKWFDISKGYGFIVSKDLDGDVLLHKTVVEAFGCTAVLDGATVECDVTQKVRGVQSRFQALRLHSVDPAKGDARLAEENSGRKEIRAREILLEPTGPSIEAECKWFSRPKGFGFVISSKAAGDIFVHMDLLRRYDMKELKPGQKVLVRAGMGPKGLTATEIHLVPEAVTNIRPFLVITTPAEFAA